MKTKRLIVTSALLFSMSGSLNADVHQIRNLSGSNKSGTIRLETQTSAMIRIAESHETLPSKLEELSRYGLQRSVFPEEYNYVDKGVSVRISVAENSNSLSQTLFEMKRNDPNPLVKKAAEKALEKRMCFSPDSTKDYLRLSCSAFP